MASDEVDRHSGRHLAVPVVEAHVAGVDAAHHRRHVVHREGAPDEGVAHAPARAEAHLAILDVIPRLREQVVVAGVVPVHVGHDHVPDGIGLAPRAPSSLPPPGRHELPVPPCALGPVEAGVDQDRAAAADHDPDVEVDRHRRVVEVGRLRSAAG